MTDDNLKLASETIGVTVKMSKLDPNRDGYGWTEGIDTLRIIGCPDMRQCEIQLEFGTLYFRERGKDDSHLVTMDFEQFMRRIWVSIIKANDGMDMGEAFKSGLKVLPGFEYLTVAGEPEKD